MKELLNWRLEFKSKIIDDEYYKEYNESAFQLTRITTIMVLLTSVAAPICQFIATSQNIIDFDLYECLYLFLIWCILWIPGLFLWKKIREHGGLVGALIFGGLSIITNITNLINKNHYLYDHHGSTVGLLFVTQAAVIRLSWKHFLPITTVSLILSCIVAFNTTNATPIQKAGYSVPNILYVILCIYIGYSFEKWAKVDFFQRKLADSSVAKLDWTAARDASLLRNIFPKNLSDELETKISTIGYSSNLDEKLNRLFMADKRATIILAQTIPNKFSDSSISPISFSSSPDPSPYPSPYPSISSSLSVSVSPMYGNGINFGNSDSGELRSSTNSLLSNGYFKHFRNKKKKTVPPLTVAIPIEEITRSNSQTNEKFPKIESQTTISIQKLQATESNQKLQRIESTGMKVLPPIITSLSRSKYNDPDHPFGLHKEVSSPGTPLHTPNHKPEMEVYLSGSRHADGSSISLSHSYPNVCVIFSDIVGFTVMSSVISPQELVTLLNDLFTKFDTIMDKYHLEKIRTIGDAYLCVANMSIPIENPEQICVCVALEMIEVLKTVNKPLSLRVGISSGPLIAGVTGTTKWNYDIFGKTLSDTNLMETFAPHNCVAVSESIFNSCKLQELFTIHQSEEGVNYYVVTSDKLQHIPEGLGSTINSTYVEDNLALLAQPKLSKLDREVLDYIDVLQELHNDEGDVENPDTLMDLPNKLGYAREDVDKEAKILRGRKLYMRFTIPEFETAYYKVTVSTVRNYVKYYCILLGIFQIIKLMVDFAINDESAVPLVVKVTFPISSAFLFLYTIFADYLDFNYMVTSFMAFFVACSYGISLLITYFYMNSILHITWSMISILILTGFIRVPALLLIVAELLVTVGMTIYISLHTPDFKYSNHYVVIMWAFVVVSSYSIISIQKSLRGRFLAHRRLKYDMSQQKIAQHRAQQLLHNILPSEIIPRLYQPPSEDNTGVVDLFEQATIMFVNITNLVEITKDLDPSNTFQVYNELFTLFDEATHAFGLEKIKTINTVYMVACGLPIKIVNHVDMAIKLAVEIYSIAKNYSFPLIDKKIQIRIGIASGPVVAGIIGKKKYSYDCWSDTTNTASRMESNGWNGYLQATPKSFGLTSFQKHFSKRDHLHIKGKGVMDTYVLQLSKFVP